MLTSAADGGTSGGNGARAEWLARARAEWLTRATAEGIGLEELAARTCKSYSLVYLYARGKRRPTDAWLALVWQVIANGPWPKEGCQ